MHEERVAFGGARMLGGVSMGTRGGTAVLECDGDSGNTVCCLGLV